MTELGAFARFWTPGAVKTRLAASIGPVAAAEIYRASLALTLQRCQGFADRNVLAITPAGHEREFGNLAGSGWTARLQGAGDLGERMATYFSEAFATQATRVVLIGSDSPTLPTDFIDQAFEHLQHTPVVLGPATDGGYYLVGLARPVPEMFTGIAWGTSAVWQQTVERLHNERIAYAELPPWHDFDDVHDLQRLHAEVVALAPHDAAYLPLLTAMETALAK